MSYTRKRTCYLIRTKENSNRHYLQKPPASVHNAQSPYWQEPRTTHTPIFAWTFLSQVSVDEYLERMKINDRYESGALVYFVRTCYANEKDAEFIGYRKDAMDMADLALKASSPTVPVGYLARSAASRLDEIRDAYIDWTRSRVPYTATGEYEVIRKLAQLYWGPLGDLPAVTGLLDSQYSIARKEHEGLERDEFWAAVLEITVEEKRDKVDRYKKEAAKFRPQNDMVEDDSCLEINKPGASAAIPSVLPELPNGNLDLVSLRSNREEMLLGLAPDAKHLPTA